MHIVLTASAGTGISSPLMEGALTSLAVAFSFAWPKLGAIWFARAERLFARLAIRRRWSAAAVGLSALLLRLAILPWHPAPLPFVPDDFSFLLAADTFALGRLSNPTPAMWIHFESIHIDMFPTYGSMYFPGQGLLLAAGKILLGHPWYGVLLAGALMCAATCWMLQAWLPPTWALLGGFIAVIRIALFSYWTNTYHSAGALTALGGALVLGALPRLTRAPRRSYALVMAAGFAILALTRPFECMLLSIPVTIELGRWLLFAKNRPKFAEFFRCTAPALVLLLAAAAWMGYYNDRVFGSPLTVPYSVNRATYAIAPYFIWQSPRPEPAYHHEEMRKFYRDRELVTFNKIHSLPGFVPQTLLKPVQAIVFFAGLAFLPALLFLPRALADRRIRFLVLCVAVLAAGMSIEAFMFPYYLAPFTAAIYAVELQAMRHLRHWRPGKQYVGRTMMRLSVTVALLMAALRPFDRVLHFPTVAWSGDWYGPDQIGTTRAGVEQRLEQLPGHQLVIVRYSQQHSPLDEWVYNDPDIDHSKIIWAREMDTASNKELVDYYKDRTVWLVQPDIDPVSLSAYAAQQ